MKMQIINTACYRRDFEVQQIKEYFNANNVEVIEEDFEVDKTADVIVLNACGFTQAAEDFGLNTLKRIEAEKKQDCKVIIGGCLPNIAPLPLKGYDRIDVQNCNKLDGIMGFGKMYNEIPLRSIEPNKKLHPVFREHGLMASDIKEDDDYGQRTRIENINSAKAISKELNEIIVPYRILCSVGCLCNCTYCAIKFGVGKQKSRPVEEILNEVKIGISKGYMKIDLEGDSFGGYGLDIGTDLGKLLDGVIRIVKGTDVVIDIKDISPAFLKYSYKQIIELANMNKLYNLYIPIQSGSQKILNLMKRGYDISEIKQMILSIKELTTLKLGTSLVIGFPGETNEDLEKTIDVCKELKFRYINVHAFSSRIGTEAESMPEKLSGEEILKRTIVLKEALRDYSGYIGTPEDTKGSRTCQG